MTSPTERTRVRRLPQRGAYDRATIHEIIDRGMICHVGFAVDGQPFVIPTIYARIGERLYIHGSAASRMLRHLGQPAPLSLCITHVDGLVLARSAFHHSMNYRSVVVVGTAERVDDEEQKFAALRALVEHVCPGRWPDVRPPNPTEMKATTVLAISLDEASAKIRTGPPVDDEEDYALPCWAGVIPLQLQPGAPIADPRLTSNAPAPDVAALLAAILG